MIRLWDFACECGKRFPDQAFDNKIPETIPCDCGKRAGWVTQKKNHIHRSLSSMYGKMDPRFGVVVESYEHKKALLKEAGLEEMEVERYDDIQNDVADKAAREARVQRDPNMLVGDSVEEIMSKISTDQIDRGATGNLMGREDQDPESGLIESWREL